MSRVDSLGVGSDPTNVLRVGEWIIPVYEGFPATLGNEHQFAGNKTPKSITGQFVSGDNRRDGIYGDASYRAGQVLSLPV